MGACVTGDTLITLLDGTCQTIKQIVEEQKIKQIPCIDINTHKQVIGNISQYCNIGLRNTIRITTDKGNTIEGTYEHPLLVQYAEKNIKHIRWERLDQLALGNNIAVPYKTAYFGNIHNKYARLIGILIGDGSYSQKYVSLSTKDDEIFNFVKQYDDKVYITKEFITKNNEHFKELRLHKCIYDIMESVKLIGQASLQKTLPYNWQSWDKESLANLVAGLFDTDGNLYMSDKKSPIISYTSICKNIVGDLKLILLKFGIHATIQSRLARTHNMPNGHVSTSKEYYVLKIMGQENITNFANNIKLLIQYRVYYIQRMLQWFKGKKIKIPRNFQDTDIRFEKIVNIEYNKNYVYDLTVDHYHSFIGNNIYSHNTNAKLIKIGTPKFRNHFYDSMEGKGSSEWCTIKRDWTRCPQLWALDATILPDHEDPTHTRERPYSTFVLTLMPKSLKQEYFPTRPDVWTEGQMSVEDFKTQYMLEFVDGAAQFLTTEECEQLKNGEFDWLTHGQLGETYFAGIDFAGSGSDTADFTHISVIRLDERTNQKQKVFAYEMQGVSYPEQIRQIEALFGGMSPRFICKRIFADFTGCGRPVVETLIQECGLTQMTGITFNASDTFTHTGMNLKNAMYAYAKQEIDYDRFKYPSLERYTASAGKENVGFWHKMIGEWSDLECEQKISVNKRISAPSGSHDDVTDSDVLSLFGSLNNGRRKMPRPVFARMSR